MINQSNIFKKIGYILNELQDQYQFLSENPEQLSELELELFLANANFLSDHVEIVKKMNNSKPLKELPEHISAPENEFKQPDQYTERNERLSVEQIEREELQQEDLPPTFEFIIDQNAVNDRVDFDEQAVDDIFDKSLSYEEEQLPAERPQSTDSTVALVSAHTEESDIVREPFLLPAEHQQPEQPAYQQYQAPAAQPEIKENLVPQTELIVDKVEEKQIPRPTTELQIDKVEEKEMPQATFNSRQESIPQSPGQRPTLNDLLALKGNSGNVEESVKAPITDLKRSITLNEKLLYIKDLFNGYNLAYSEAIDLINKMPDFKTADSFLKNSYAVKNNWEAKPTTVAQFYELLKQRFPEG